MERCRHQYLFPTHHHSMDRLEKVKDQTHGCKNHQRPKNTSQMRATTQGHILRTRERVSLLKGISIELSREAGKFTKEVEVPRECQRHQRMFDPVESKKLPPSRPWDHAITLKPDAPDMLDCKLYLLPPKDDKALCKWLKEEEEKGYIRPSILPIVSLFFFLQKADGSQRPIQDYRGVNRWTIRNWYPLPLIPELIAEVRDAFVFTKFDVEGGFNKVQIKDGDQHKAAFKTKYSLYKPMVMYFCYVPNYFPLTLILSHMSHADSNLLSHTSHCNSYL